MASRRPRGFTLIELLVVALISTFTIGLIASTLLNQVSAYRQHINLRTAQVNTRQGLAFLQESLRSVGYGVDPDRAIIAYDSFDADAPTASPGAGYPDAVALHTRELRFQRTATAVTSSQLTFDRALTEDVPKGQILLVLCRNLSRHAYVTVGAQALAGAFAVTLSSTAGSDTPLSMPGPRFHEQAALSGCLADTPKVVMVRRSAFFIGRYDDDGNATTPRQPYLMLHQGLDLNADTRVDAADATPLAPFVEQLQLAYILNSVSTAPPLIRGVTGADVPWGDTWAANAPLPVPKMSDEYWNPSRLTSHPANVRQVRATLVARGPAAAGVGETTLYDADAPGTAGVALSDGQVPWRQLENLGDAPATVPATTLTYPRRVLRLSVAPKNLLIRSQFLPFNADGG